VNKEKTYSAVGEIIGYSILALCSLSARYAAIGLQALYDKLHLGRLLFDLNPSMPFTYDRSGNAASTTYIACISCFLIEVNLAQLHSNFSIIYSNSLN